MSMINKALLPIFFVIIMTSAWSSDELLEFDSKAQEERYLQLIEELRCPKCLNQSIADSNAGISEDLRNLVYEKIKAGDTDKEIRLYLSERYGDFILYKPDVSGANLLLWFGPIVIILMVFIMVVLKIKSKARDAAKPTEMSDSELERVQKLLNESSSSQQGKSK
ncbi:cytochrome c-type biogenesis protein [Pleionea sediminis]|uniref:cytochrome c-type biogenesis protein n=1 Tax=Pleionea sediminis TaxID=2569479 RepID=UPI001185BFAE|nr:cytochrome c-type biogenesis protein [Pleionea sediminis]